MRRVAPRDDGASAPLLAPSASSSASSAAPPSSASSLAALRAASSDGALPPAPPADAYRVVLGIFLLMGVGMLFPWNVFITADAFWRGKLAGSPFADNFQRSAMTMRNKTRGRARLRER